MGLVRRSFELASNSLILITFTFGRAQGRAMGRERSETEASGLRFQFELEQAGLRSAAARREEVDRRKWHRCP